MNRQATNSRDEHAALLLRMAQSRDALREANAIALIPRRQRNSVMTSVTGAAVALANAPHVTLLLALCVGALTIGPPRALRTILRTGISAWVANGEKQVGRR